MNNVNYNPEKLAYYSEENARERYENEKRRKLTDMAIRNQSEPWERETPDEKCTCPDSNWASLSCPLHGIDILEGIVDISEGEE